MQGNKHCYFHHQANGPGRLEGEVDDKAAPPPVGSKQAKSGSTPSFLPVRDRCNQGYYESLAVSIPKLCGKERVFPSSSSRKEREKKKLRDTKAEPVVSATSCMLV